MATAGADAGASAYQYSEIFPKAMIVQMSVAGFATVNSDPDNGYFASASAFADSGFRVAFSLDALAAFSLSGQRIGSGEISLSGPSGTFSPPTVDGAYEIRGLLQPGTYVLDVETFFSIFDDGSHVSSLSAQFALVPDGGASLGLPALMLALAALGRRR